MVDGQCALLLLVLYVVVLDPARVGWRRIVANNSFIQREGGGERDVLCELLLLL